jgi:hypothetical protein
MYAQYGENCIMQRKVYQWVEGFQSGRTNVVDEGHYKLAGSCLSMELFCIMTVLNLIL